MAFNLLKGIVARLKKDDHQPSFLPAISTDKPKTHQEAAPPRDLVPENFYSFEVYIDIEIDGKLCIGKPSVCVRTSGRERWGVAIDWMLPKEGQAHSLWVDDPDRGISARKLVQIEDVLGAEGRIGDMRLRFERILDCGESTVVYALFCPEKRIRVAYSFSRTVFEPAYVRKPTPRGL